MSLKIAEYFGQRTDVDLPQIKPQKEGDCPFACNHPCKKIKSHKHPVCAVRRNDGRMWIVCPERLCSTKKDVPLCDHQKNILLNIAQVLFGNAITPDEVLIRREQPLSVNDGTDYKADYIMINNQKNPTTSGPLKLVLEMQGGGETTNTGELTRFVSSWERLEKPTNQYLRTLVEGTSTLETNAWRRQQEQFLVKGNVATKSERATGMAFVVGTLLFDYLAEKLRNANLPDLKNANWTLAIIAVDEDKTKPIAPGPIPIKIDTNRLLFTNYSAFVTALTNQGLPCPNAFRGTFINLNGLEVEIN